MARIFFLRATVFRLSLNDRTIENAFCDVSNFYVRVDLIGIPSLIIGRNDGSLLEIIDFCEDNCPKYSERWAARACHFVAEWKWLVEGLKRKPLKIGVYRGDERFPVCHGVLPFSGCVCDLVSQAMQQSSSFELHGDFNLIDPGGNPAGLISLAIDLNDLGRHVNASFALDRDRFVAKSGTESDVEYACVGGDDLKNFHDERHDQSDSPLTLDDRSALDCARERFMQTGICLAARDLSHGKAEVEKARESWRDAVQLSDGNETKLSSGDQTGQKKLAAKKSKKKKK